MKIRYLLHNAYGGGGTIRSVVNQANALCDEHDVEIASVYRTGDDTVFAIDPRVRLVPLTELRETGARRSDRPGQRSRLANKTRRFRNPLPHRHDSRYRNWDPLVDLTIIRYLRSARGGVLVTTRPALNLLSAWFGSRKAIRIAQDHMNLGLYKPPLRAAILRAYPRLDAVAVLTEHDRATYAAGFGDRKVRLERIPNGIPPWPLPPAQLESKVLVAAGRLVRQKGFDLLITAFAAVSARHPDWQLRIFGWGAKKAKLTAQIAELGLTGRVRLEGPTRRLDHELAAASGYVLSSRFEGLPLVLLEAASAGVPAVAFDCPTGPAEIIEHGRNGLLVPPKDVAGLAEGMNRLIEQPAERRAMGAAARADSGRFAMAKVRDDWERLFTDLAAARGWSPPAPALGPGEQQSGHDRHDRQHQ
ncbi:glycosyltransferase family 4 protein [Actinoplanes sp. NPDC049599]|uniref:glycosyltransferase family 4 protein n=1 Tax=Actinoplanes sp. NPDC049599 TaxID=3363903 RepID=UPI0037897A3A